MPLQCSANGCKYHNKDVPKEKGVTFHRFPHRDANRLWVWVVNMKMGKWTPKARSLVCSRHFTPDSFEGHGQKIRLTRTAIPTIFVFPKDVPQAPCRKPSIDENAPKPNKFQSACLTAHNTIRDEFGIPKLSWSEDAATSAKEWAKTLANKGYLQHSENRVFGENILITEEKENVSGSQVVGTWLEESDVYKFELPMWQYNTSHFTQMIWKNSTEFGVAKARMRNKNKYVVVAHYKPIGNGNMPGEYKKNIPSDKVNVSLDIRQDPESDPESEPEPEKERHALARTPSKRKAQEIVNAAMREESAKRAAPLPVDDAVATNMHEITEDVVQQECKVVKTTPIWDASEYNDVEMHGNDDVTNKDDDVSTKLNGLSDIQMVEFDDGDSAGDDHEGEEVIQEDAVGQEIKVTAPVNLTFMEESQADQVDDQEFKFETHRNGQADEYPEPPGISYSVEYDDNHQNGVVLNRDYSDDDDTEV